MNAPNARLDIISITIIVSNIVQKEGMLKIQHKSVKNAIIGKNFFILNRICNIVGVEFYHFDI